MARHLKKKKKSHSWVWVVLGIACLAAFFLGYWFSVSGITFW